MISSTHHVMKTKNYILSNNYCVHESKSQYMNSNMGEHLNKFFTVIFILFTSIHLYSSGIKDASRAKTVNAVKLSSPLVFDGLLSESVYTQTPVTEFIQRDPNQGEPATEITHVWVTYDDSHIYFAGHLYDSQPDLIDASLMRRDNIVESDWMFIFIDPYFDRRTGYYFAVNAGGSLADGTLFNDSWDDNSWDGIWEAQTNIDESGWTFEMRIPFSQLRFKESEDMKWGVNFNRDIKRKSESSYFVMVPKEESGFVSHFAALEGLIGINPGQRFELLPYVVQKAQYLIHDSADPFYSGKQYKTSLGGDFNIGIGSNITLNGTINPDFGQVEVDPAVVNLTAFETFFEEKRPFFIEGSNIFYFGFGGANNNWGFNFGVPELFYSRRIGRLPQGSTPDYDYIDYPNETVILGAAKLTGKINESWSIGAISATTQRMFATLSADNKKFKEEIEPLTHYGVFRTRREFDEGRNAVGIMFTSVNRDLRTKALQNSLVDQAYSFGIDGWTTLDSNDTYVVNGSVIGSYVQGSGEAIVEKQLLPYRYLQRPDAFFMRLDSNLTSLSGYYARVMLNKQKGNFYINTALGIISPGFENNDIGFQWMADRINGHMVLGYRWYEPDNVFRSKQFYLSHFRTYNFDGDLITNGLFLLSRFQLLNYYTFELRAEYLFETFNPRLTRGGPMAKNPANFWIGYNARSDARKNFVVGFGGDYSKDEFESYSYEFELNFEWKPDTRINISFGPGYEKNYYRRQWINSFEDPFAAETYNKRYVFGTIDQETFAGNIRLNWTFTPQLSLQLFLQPLFSVGEFSEFKELARPRSNQFNYYDKSGSSIEYNPESDEYAVDPDGDGSAEKFYFTNPNFNFKSLRGNLVLRYEILPGSVFYLVWTHDKTNFDDPGQFKFGRDFANLWQSESNNIFMAKFSYWFDI